MVTILPISSPVLCTVLVFPPKSLFSITLSLITLIGNRFSFHFIALCYKRMSFHNLVP